MHDKIFGSAPSVSPMSVVATPIPETLLRMPSTNPAEWMRERITRSIIDFEKELTETEEVGARLVNFGTETIIIEDVGYWGQDLIIFYGKNANGHPVELLQHITQVSVLLVAVPAQTEKPRRIGFILEQKLKSEEDKT